MKRKVILTALCLVLAGVVCTGSADAAKKVRLNRTKAVIQKGKTMKLTLKNAKKKKVKWYTSNKRIVTVSKYGKIRALRKGKAKIYAKYRSKKYVCTVRVTATAKKNAGVRATQSPVSTQSPAPAQKTLSVLSGVYISGVVHNTYDWYVMIDYQDAASGTQKFSNSYASFQKAEITLNGARACISDLREGDELEIGYYGRISQNRYTTIPEIQYVKAVRS